MFVANVLESKCTVCAIIIVNIDLCISVIVNTLSRRKLGDSGITIIL